MLDSVESLTRCSARDLIQSRTRDSAPTARLFLSVVVLAANGVLLCFLGEPLPKRRPAAEEEMSRHRTVLLPSRQKFHL